MKNKCPICSKEAVLKDIQLNNVLGKKKRIYLCKSCKHAFIEDMPDDLEINKFYSQSIVENTDTYKKAFQKEIKHIKSGFYKYIESAENVLEIGPGSLGITSLLNKDQNYSIVEKSTANVQNLQSLINESTSTLSVYDDIDNIPDSVKFDLVVCLEVIEHLNNPIEYIRMIKKHLKRGAICIFSVPNRKTEIPSIDFEGFRVDTAVGHLQFYSNESLKKLFADFEILHFNEEENFYEKNLYKLSSLYSVFQQNNKMIKSAKMNIRLFGLLFTNLIHKLIQPNREFNNYRKYLVLKVK